MKTLHLSIIIASLFFALLITSHVYAQCAVVNGKQTCLGMNPLLASIKLDKLLYENSDKPIITITGVPNKSEYLEIDNQSGDIVFSHSLELPSTGVTNYTLDISSYKPGLYSAIANTSASKASTNFRVSQVPLSGPTVVFNIINSTYGPGDSISILGYDGPDGTIQLSLIDPNNKTVSSIQVNSDNIGQFSSDALKIPTNGVSGMWTINATHGIAQGSQKIKVNSLNNTVSTINSPLQQLKSGIEAKDVVCKVGLQLIIKKYDNSPACVKPETAQTLIERGWAQLIPDKSGVTMNPYSPSNFQKDDNIIENKTIALNGTTSGPGSISSTTDILFGIGFDKIIPVNQDGAGNYNFVLKPGSTGIIGMKYHHLLSSCNGVWQNDICLSSQQQNASSYGVISSHPTSTNVYTMPPDFSFIGNGSAVGITITEQWKSIDNFTSFVNYTINTTPQAHGTYDIMLRDSGPGQFLTIGMIPYNGTFPSVSIY